MASSFQHGFEMHELVQSSLKLIPYISVSGATCRLSNTMFRVKDGSQILQRG